MKLYDQPQPTTEQVQRTRHGQRELQEPATAAGTVYLLSRSEEEDEGVIGITTSGQPANKLRVCLLMKDYALAVRAHLVGDIVEVAGDLQRQGNLTWLYHARLTGVVEPQLGDADEDL